MITKKQYDEFKDITLKKLREASIVITKEEEKKVEIADFGLNNLEKVGLQLLVYVNTNKVCAKEMVLLPFQTCPEHIHQGGIDENGNSFAGKEETFRVRKGICYLYICGKDKEDNGNKNIIKAKIPPTEVTVFNEIILREGEQHTIFPNTWHWFQAGKEGAIISEFSTTSRDEYDLFRDKKIKRIPEIKE